MAAGGYNTAAAHLQRILSQFQAPAYCKVATNPLLVISCDQIAQ